MKKCTWIFEKFRLEGGKTNEYPKQNGQLFNDGQSGAKKETEAAFPYEIYRVSGQGADTVKLYDKLISKNQDADKTGNRYVSQKGADIIQSARFKEVSKKAEELLKEKRYR